MSRSLDEILAPDPEELGVVLQAARFRDDLADEEAEAWVTPLGEVQAVGPCHWSPRVRLNGSDLEIVYPDRGDLALVTESEDGSFWILVWTPYD